MVGLKNMEMDSSRAILSNVGMSVRKVNSVVSSIRGMKVSDAELFLKFLNKRASFYVRKCLSSAVANADYRGLDIDSLFIHDAYVNKSFVMKRRMPGARGRASIIRKERSSITIMLVVRYGTES